MSPAYISPLCFSTFRNLRISYFSWFFWFPLDLCLHLPPLSTLGYLSPLFSLFLFSFLLSLLHAFLILVFSFLKTNKLSPVENFPGSSVGRESACNAGDPSSIPGSGRSSGEQIGYPLQYSQAFLVAHLVMNPPAIWKTWVWSLGWEGPLKKEDSYPLLYSGLENSMDCSLWGHKELDMTERLSLHFTSLPYFLFLFHFLFIFFILLLSMSYLYAFSLSPIWPNKVLKHYICCTSLKKIFRPDFYIWVKLAKQL